MFNRSCGDGSIGTSVGTCTGFGTKSSIVVATTRSTIVGEMEGVIGLYSPMIDGVRSR